MLLAGHEQMLSVRRRDGRVTTRVCNVLVLLRLSCLGETYIWYNFPVAQVSGLMFTGCCAASSSLCPPIQPWHLMVCKNNDTNFNLSLAVLLLHHFTLYAAVVTYYVLVPPEFSQLGINTSAYLQESSLTLRPLETLELLLQRNLQASLEILPNPLTLHTPCERLWMCLFHGYCKGKSKVRPRTGHEGAKGE